MKKWRKQAKKTPDGRRNGRTIRADLMVRSMITKESLLTYPLLTALMKRAGFVVDTKQAEVVDEAV